MSAFTSHSEDRPEIVAGDHTLLRELLHPARDPVSAGYSLARARLEPGTRSKPHRLVGSELYYILSGNGSITIDGETVDLSPGGVVLVPAGATQHVENHGTEDLDFLCIVEPPWRAEDEAVDA